MLLKITLLLWILLLLSSCYSNPKDLEKIEELEDKLSSSQDSTLENDIFSKKIECSKVNIDSDIKENWWKYANNYDIEEIFYSKTKNSCVWIINLYDDEIKDIWAYDILQKDWFLTYFTNPIWLCNFWDEYNDLNSICEEQKIIFDLEIIKLKTTSNPPNLWNSQK
jgi:hypothetical protein